MCWGLDQGWGVGLGAVAAEGLSLRATGGLGEVGGGQGESRQGR